jgi:hypothetical protein
MANAADNPMAFLNMARKYQKAASRLLDSVAQEPRIGPQVPLSDPIYFLYFQTVELALKAFLLFHGESVPTWGPDGHDIIELHRRCGLLGLRHADPMGLGNIVNLLASGHEGQGFRYFTLKSGAIPDLTWTREIVNLLIQSIREVVVDKETDETVVKIQILVGKPYERPKGS